MSDAESVASSSYARNASGKVMKRKPSRRRTKPRSATSPETVMQQTETRDSLPKPVMETPTAPRRTSKMFDNSQNISR